MSKDKKMALALTIYLAALLWINAMILEKNTVIVCFDIGTAATLLAAGLLGGNDGRA